MTLRITIPLFVALCALATACRSEVDDAVADTEAPTVMMRVGAQLATTKYNTLTLDDIDPEMSPPVFMFWDASTFIDETVLPDLFFVTSPEEPAPTYTAGDGSTKRDTATWYDTGHPYLNDDETVLASGFIPSGAASVKEPATTDADGKVTKEATLDYTRLTLPPDMLARDSLWIAKEALLGSSYNPFSKALRFIHATTRIVFKGQRAEGMGQRVHNVTVTVSDPAYVLYRMKWKYYYTASTLKKNGFVAVDYDKAVDYDPLTDADKAALSARLTHTFAGNLPGYSVAEADNTQRSDLGTFYLRPGLTGLRVDITATMGTATTYEVKNLPINFQDTDGNPVTLGSGDSYELVLKFNSLNLELNGVKTPFTNGGNAYITIRPFGSSEN